jgi:hypothetical protein
MLTIVLDTDLMVRKFRSDCSFLPNQSIDNLIEAATSHAICSLDILENRGISNSPLFVFELRRDYAILALPYSEEKIQEVTNAYNEFKLNIMGIIANLGKSLFKETFNGYKAIQVSFKQLKGNQVVLETFSIM